MRTKKADASKSNGSSTKPTKKRAINTLPNVPPENLSEAHRAEVKRYLEESDRPFIVVTQSNNRKRKSMDSTSTSTSTGVGNFQLQEDLYEARLSVQYEVRQRQYWEALRKYKRFTVGNESIATGQCILVKHDTSEDARMDPAAQWKAKVLEVRALDPEHVYLRVAWLNRPEDLFNGRKSYHGRNELIPTNEIDVIDAMTVNGALEVTKWDEDGDQTSMPAEDQYFWRQTYDSAITKSFSKLRQMCIDNTPHNPDELIIQCVNADCRKWMHVKCIAEEAVRQASGASSTQSPAAPGKRKRKRDKQVTKEDGDDDDNEVDEHGRKTNNKSSAAVAKAEHNTFVGEVFLKGHSPAQDGDVIDRNEVIVTEPSGHRVSAPLSCLFCGTAVE